MSKTFLVTLILLSLSSVSFAHKFPLEQGVQESDILRLEIIENIVDPCYMTIAWEKEVEATLKHGERDVLARLKMSAYDEIEATVQEVTPLVQDMSEPEDRMRVYAKITGLCVKATQ